MMARPSTLILLSCLCGCIAYERDPATPASIAADVGLRRGGSYSADDAILLALRQNPALRALEALERAAGAATTVPLPTTGEFRGRNEAVGIMLDPIALLGLGPRGAAIATAEARQVAAVAATVVARWQTIGALTEEFFIDTALAHLQVPELDLDATEFAAAGLASPVAAQQLRAATARLASERAELARSRIATTARLRELMGLPGNAAVSCQPVVDGWLEQPPGNLASLLDRPDLLLAAARFETADAAFRQAVAEQYPSFDIGPNVSLRGDPLRAMGMLRIPIAMHGLAEAARERRLAARNELESALLNAQREATTRDAELAAARALLTATEASLQASLHALTAARAALEVEADAFAPFASAAQRVARDLKEHRLATVGHARTAVQRASSYGWPRHSQPEASR